MKLALVIVAALVLCFFAIGFAGVNSPEGQERAMARLSIEHCWDEQKRKSLDPDQQRFIAGACERMEAKYVAKYGRKP